MAEKDFRVRKGLVVDGTSSATSVAVTTGNVVVAAGTIGLTDGLLLSTVSGSPNVSKITSQPTNGNIHIEPNGTGDIVLVTDTLDTTGDALTFKVKDNEAAGLDIATADHSYVKLVTTNSGEELNLAGGFGTITTGAAAVATTITQTSSAANTNAVDLTIKGGSPPTGGTNNAGTGGDIILSAGQGKGTAAGGSIKFKVAPVNSTDAATLNALSTVMTISDDPKINFHSTDMTNVDINSGAIDGTTIGASSVSSGRFSTLKALATGYISRLSALQSSTRFQVDGYDTGGALYGTGQTAVTGTTSSYAEMRLFSDIAADDLSSQWNDYSGMSGLLVIDNADDVPGLGQGIALTVGEGGGAGDSWAIGRMSGSNDSDFTIGFYPKPYEDIGYKHASNTATNDFNPFKAAQSVFKIAKGGDVTLLGNKGDTVNGGTGAHEFNPVSLKFQGVNASGGTQFAGFKLPTQLAASNSIYTFPTAYPGSDKVLQSTSAGVLSWVTQSGGITVSGTDHRMVRMDGTTGIQDTGITVDDSNNISGVGTLAATTITSSLGFVSTKDTDGEFIALTLTNESDAADTTGIVSQLFNLEDTSGNAVDSGKIAVKKEASFTSTASTQDSSMVFSTSLNGTLTEQVTIDSAGQLGIGASPSYTLDVTAPAATVPKIRVKSINSSDGPQMIFEHDDGGTASNGDQIGTIKFLGEDDGGGQNEYGRIGVKASAVAANNEGGRIEFYVPKTGNGAMSNLDPHMSIISGNSVLTSTVDIACNLIVDGDLTVRGTNTILNTDELQVEDNVVTLNYSTGDSSGSADGSGIVIQDAVDASNDASLLWTASTDRFGFSHGLDVTGSLTADTSLTLDAVTISTAEIQVLDGVTAGTVTASRALVVDSNRDLNDSSSAAAHLRDVRMRNLTTTGTVTSTGAVTSTQFSTDYGDIKTVQVASGTINDTTSVTIVQIDSTAYRGAEVLTTVYNDTDNTTDLFKTVIMWDGHDTTLNDSSAACHYTNYAVLSSGDVAKGDISAVKNGANIDVKFTSSSGSNDTYVIRAQLILLDI